MEDMEVDALAMDQGGSSEPQEKMLNAQQVNDIVRREKANAADKVRREYEAKMQGEPQSAPQSNMGGVDTSAIAKQVREDLLDELQRAQEAQQHQQLVDELQNTADTYHMKMKKGSELFDDFQEVIADFEPSSFPTLVRLAAPMENLSEIMYELAKNPSKLQEIDALAAKAPKLAMKQLEKLSQSVGKNLEAKANSVTAPAPLSKIKPSSVGADTGKMTLRDLKKQSFLKG